MSALKCSIYWFMLNDGLKIYNDYQRTALSWKYINWLLFMMRTRQRIKSNENYEAGEDVVITKGNERRGSKLCLSTSTRDNCCSLKTSWLLHARGMPLSIHDTLLYESSSCTTSLVDTLVRRVASSSGNVGHICLYSGGSTGT